ncbi:hypothetical protein [Paraburkholderia fungorum]|uniref:hypothetical protein n=1 Tax=Paraburkholderia fungorum TaxID=134537 RepID=UPI00217D97DC|nr:hypothetical protein [Paraburkholderia fungorum]
MKKPIALSARRLTVLREPLIAVSALLCVLLSAPGPACAQSIEDKLRSQLRSTTQDLRQLQDTQAQLQADKTAAEQQRDKALADLKQAQAELAAAKGKSGAEVAAERALSSEKTSHAQDAQQLQKSRTEYQNLLATTRSHDADRTQMQAELKAREAQLQRCEAQNAELDQVGHDILNAYEHVGFGTIFKLREPFAQSARVKYDDIAQRYGDALHAGRFNPAAMPAKASSDPAAAPPAAAAAK